MSEDVRESENENGCGDGADMTADDNVVVATEGPAALEITPAKRYYSVLIGNRVVGINTNDAVHAAMLGVDTIRGQNGTGRKFKWGFYAVRVDCISMNTVNLFAVEAARNPEVRKQTRYLITPVKSDTLDRYGEPVAEARAEAAASKRATA